MYNSNLTEYYFPMFKKGNKIHIKKSHEGRFTSYCGGKVTDACIQKGKNSPNPAVRKLATFAANARKWKGLYGGNIPLYVSFDTSNLLTTIPTEYDLLDNPFESSLSSTDNGIFLRDLPKIKLIELPKATTTTQLPSYSLPTSTKDLSSAFSKYLGAKYSYGGTKDNAMDCSAFTRKVYNNLLGKNLPRTAAELYNAGLKIDKSLIQAGDSIVLRGTNSKKGKNAVSHIMFVNSVRTGADGLPIYNVAEASSSKGVIQHDITLGNNYYGKKFGGAVRFSKKGGVLKFEDGALIPLYVAFTTSVPSLYDLLDNPYEAVPEIPSIPNSSKDRLDLLKLKIESKQETPAVSTKVETKVSTPIYTKAPTVNLTPELSDSISSNMLKNLLYAEGKNNLTAAKTNGESFVTGPYGMVYKYDKQGNIIGKWKLGEKATEELALLNALNYYTKTVNDWKTLLKGKFGLTLNKLDALVSASGGNKKSVEDFKKFVVDHWGDDNAIASKLRNFATTALGKKLPGLVLRRLFEADWYLGNNKDFNWYLKNRKLYGV